MSDKTGRLIEAGLKKCGGLAGHYCQCVDCLTFYPHMSSNSKAKCNGVEIDLCPWCRPDSEPFKHGRGI